MSESDSDIEAEAAPCVAVAEFQFNTLVTHVTGLDTYVCKTGRYRRVKDLIPSVHVVIGQVYAEALQEPHGQAGLERFCMLGFQVVDYRQSCRSCSGSGY